MALRARARSTPTGRIAAAASTTTPSTSSSVERSTLFCVCLLTGCGSAPGPLRDSLNGAMLMVSVGRATSVTPVRNTAANQTPRHRASSSQLTASEESIQSLV
ncbi:uncharacterized protein LOC124272091 [Haliotis rubra]|uniref:uncharacterized protein LOC124272091 n=1 Tax=Haliotis rubra TaxID=36100 RepID=UPI001EE5915D|nr:uncharacterized protein LOC124272091 [Haliotis rubra]